jgi:endonuclease/exonuclease/phosphatase family metal-dependent hydrolase
MDAVPRRWTVTTWNVRGTAEPPLDHVAAVLRDTEADVVVLQEVQRAQAKELAGRLGMQHAWALKHHPRTPLMWWQAEGLAILTPHRLSDTGSASLTPDRSTWTWRRRIVQWGLVERDDHSAHRVVNLHLTPHDEPEQRRTEVRRVVEMFPVDRGAPLVLCGDLNDDGEDGVVDALPGREALPPQPTSPAETPTKCLDHVLVPVAASDVHQHVPSGGPTWATLSDHLPVTVSFSLDWVEGDWPPVR